LSHLIRAFFITSRARSGIDSGTFQDNRTNFSIKIALIALETDSASSELDSPSSIILEQEVSVLTELEVDNEDDVKGADTTSDEN
jgi:hypothetical protein